MRNGMKLFLAAALFALGAGESRSQGFIILQELTFKLTGYYQMEPTETSSEIRLHTDKISITNREILELLEIQMNLNFSDDAKLLLATAWPFEPASVPAVVVRDTVGGDTVDTDVSVHFRPTILARIEDGKIKKQTLKASGSSYDVIGFEMNLVPASFDLQCYGKTKLKTVNHEGDPIGYTHTGKLNASGSGETSAIPGEPPTALALTGTVDVKDHDVEAQ